MAQDNNKALYTLYESLKADNYDVPDSYESFERTLTEKGDEGTTNRMALYNSLKSNNYDVPDTYESFANTLIEPTNTAPSPTNVKFRRGTREISVTDEEAAGGILNVGKIVDKKGNEPEEHAPFFSPSSLPHVPWKPTLKEKLAWDNKIFDAQQQSNAMFAEQREYMNNMKEYEQRGGAFTSLQGGVVEGNPVYNPETDKLEKTYLTPTGDRTTNEAYACFVAGSYRRATAAVDMSVGAQIRRAQAELEGLKAQLAGSQARVHKEWKEDYEKNDAPLAAVLASETYVPRQMSDKENRALRVAIHYKEEALKDLYEERDRQIGKDVGFWRGFGRTVSDVRTWDFGMGDVYDAMTMLNADQYSSPKATEGEKKAGQAMMKAIQDRQQVEKMYGGNASFLNKAGVMTGYMPSFMLDFALTGGGYEGLNVAGKAATRTATKLIGKEAIKEMAKSGVKQYAQKYGVRGVGRMAENWTIKALGTTVDDLLIRAPLMTNTVQVGKTSADIIDRKLGDVVIDENGNYDFSNDKTWGSAVWQGEANAIIENYSEMFGTHLDGVVPALTKSLSKTFGGKRISSMLARANASSYGQILATTRKQFERLGVSDYFGEVSEEYYGQLWRSMLNLDDAYTNVPVVDEQGNQVLDETGSPVYERKNLLFTGQFHGDIWGGMALSMGLMGAGKYTISGIAYADMKHQVNKADRKAAEVFTPEKWESIRELIDNTTNEDMGLVAENIIGDKSLSDEERDAAMSYMERSLNLRGYNLGAMAQSRGAEGDTTEQELSESYIDGYEASSPQEMNDAQNMYELQRQRVEGMFEADLLSQLDTNPVNELTTMSESGLYSQEELDAARDYVNAKAVRDGIVQRVNNDIDEQIAQSDAMINGRVSNATGMIQPATMGLDNRQVYIVGGKLAINPDGTIDNETSDESIVVRDALTGELEFTTPKSIVSVGDAIDPEQEKEVAADTIRQQAAQLAADRMNGTLSFKPGDTITIMDGDGPKNITIVGPAKDEESGMPIDGQVVVKLADGNQSVFTKDELQQRADAANLERLNGFEQERAANRAQQQAVEAEAKRPQFALNDEFTIIDEGGNHIRGSITGELDEDGKVEIHTEEPINGYRVNRYTPEELGSMIDTYNGEAVNVPENAPEDKPSPSRSALSQIPTDKQGQPLYTEADPATAWDAIVEKAHGNEDIAAEVVADYVSEAQDDFNAADKALTKLMNGKPEKRKKGEPAPTVDERIAAKEAAKKALGEAQVIRDKAKAILDHWQKIANTKQNRERERKKAEDAERAAEEARLKAEREEAERIEREALNGVPDWNVDKPSDARARGYRRNGPQKVDRPEIIDNHAVGNQVEVKFGDDVMPKGNIAIIEAEQLQPSHRDGQRNPLHFLDEAQPKERKDTASRLAAAKIAENIRPEEITSSVTAYTGAPSVNSRGEVIQGNNRGEALRIMYDRGRDSAEKYKQYLIDHAAEFGLTPEAVAAFEKPVLVNMLDISDDNAITLGQYVAQDTESGGVERIKPKNAVQKMGDKIRSFANILLQSSDEDATFAQLVDANGMDVLKWMNGQGFITNTQYASAFDSKGNLTAEAANDLKGIMYQSIFTGGSTRLEEMFNKMPAKAQRAILATAFRDYDSAFADRMINEIQQSIIAFDALMGFKQFREATNAEDTMRAVEAWKRQYAFDDVSGEPYLPSETFSNFALTLASLYKGRAQKYIQTVFNTMYDIVQGAGQDTIFEVADKTPNPLAEAIRRVLNIEYQPITKNADNGTNGDTVLDVNSEDGQDGRPGSTGNADSAEQHQEGEQPADGGTGAENNSGQGGELETPSVQASVQVASAEVNTEPTPAQAEAGNYKKGHVVIGDFNITIENPAGSIRKGIDADGKEWQTTMANTYGYIKGTESVDGDHIDVFLAGDMDAWNGQKVFVVDQTKPDGTFDEHKVMLGFNDKDEAYNAYLANYDATWAETHPGLRISETNIEDFNKWIESSRRKTKPFADYSTVSKVTDEAPVIDTNAVTDAPGLAPEDLAKDLQTTGEANLSDHSEPLTPKDKPAETPKETQHEISDDEMQSLANELRDLLGIGEDEGDAGIKFRDPGELTPQERQRIQSAGIRLAMGLVERGTTSFPDYATKMVGLLGDKIRPWLKSFYEGARWTPGYENIAFTPSEEVARFDVQNFDKRQADPIAQAAMIVEEGKAGVVSAQAQKELTEIRNNNRKKQDEQTSADTAALTSKAEAVASKAESLAKTSENTTELNRAGEEIDQTLDEISEQLALLGYYEADLNAPEHEVYGSRRSAEKKAVKDATRLAKQLIDDLGIDLEKATKETVTDRKGNKKVKNKPLSTSNLTGIDGDVTINLPMPDGRNLYINIGLSPTHERGVEPKRVGGAWEGDNLEVDRIMYRFDSKRGSCDGDNHFLEPEVTYGDLLADIRSKAKWGMPRKASERPAESKKEIGEPSADVKEKAYRDLVERFGEEISEDSFFRKAVVDNDENKQEARCNELCDKIIDLFEIAKDENNSLFINNYRNNNSRLRDAIQTEAFKRAYKKTHTKEIVETPKPTNEPEATAPVNPSGNKLVTDERYAELRERMRKKFGGQFNMGVDPEILAIGTEMAVYHIERGARKFTAYAKAMLADLGDAIRPYLKSFYNAVRDMPEVEAAGLVDEMDSYDDVRSVDIANFDKNTTDAMATAEAIVKEQEVEKEREEAEDKLKTERNNIRHAELERITRLASDETYSKIEASIAAGGIPNVGKLKKAIASRKRRMSLLKKGAATAISNDDTFKKHQVAVATLQGEIDGLQRALDYINKRIEAARVAEEAQEKKKPEVKPEQPIVGLFSGLFDEPISDEKKTDVQNGAEVSGLSIPPARPKKDLAGNSAQYQERETQTVQLVEEISGVIDSRVEMLHLDPESVKPLTMTEVKKMAKKYSELGNISDTDLQELVELAMTQLTRTEAIVNVDGTAEQQRAAFDHIVNLYQIQPSLNARDSERTIKQQYSTPTPFGYVMGQFVRAGGKSVESMLEPSAGNGALTITVPPEIVHVNDIDEARLSNLRKLGYKQVTAQDALLPFSGDKVDVVMTNPPFGTVSEKVYDGIFHISSLEGQMAINALEQMKDDGRAAIVIGGNTSYRTNGSMNPKDAAFFGYLYSRYNVADVINISGKALYSRNGTGYDVRMILIDGRKAGEFQRVFPPVKAKARAEQVTTFDELYNRIQDDIHKIQQVGSESADVQREPEATPNGTAGATVRSTDNRTDTSAGERPSTTSGTVRNTPRPNRGQSTTDNDGHRPDGVDNADSGNAGSSDNVSQSKPQQPGDDGRGSTRNGTGRSGGDGRGATTSRPDRSTERLEVKPDLTTEKVPYPNQSENGFTLMSVVPAAQAQVLQRSLGEIGDVDQYLVDELGYSSKEELYSYLAAEQIDSVALAIHQMNKGNAFIIGDMTGVGKGRQGAALIRYAVKQGRVPIYFTQKPTLFTDNYRDLADIGSSDLRPFIIASNPKDASIVDADGNMVHKLPTKKEQQRVFDYIMEHGTLPDEYDYVLTTYDQIKNGTSDYSQNEDGSWNVEARKLPKKSNGYTTADFNGQMRRDALATLAEGNIAILDESHTVGGDSGCGRYMQMLTAQAEGVTFLSATFAKRADNMPIYAQRTAIAEAGVKASELIEAIMKGGVTLQEIMSKQLVESGQMIRRERSFEGVTIDWLSVEEETDRKQREQFNEVADIFNAIRSFQNDHIKPIIDGMNEAAAEQGATVGLTQGTKDLGVKNTPFASKMYNLVNQLLFALKVDAVANRVIENLRNGYKPVISFTNTMEGFLSSAPKGEAMDEVPNFSLTLMRALDGVMRFTEKDADENSEGGSISLSQLSPEGQNAYNTIREKIMNMSADLPISPMDAIRMKIEEAGYTVAEITGRTTQLNRTEDGKYIVEARKDRDKKAAMRDFNSGKLDVLMINKSGSTGISLHASSKFEDQRQRVMVFAQFQSDINDEVQMRGRIDRSGQVTRGRYEYIMSTIPAEQRIQMMFKAKLKSLDANTTSSQKSKFNEMEIVDYLNKYGDEVVWEYMKEHPELEERLGDPLKMLKESNDEDGPRTSDKEDTSEKNGCAGKISRYLAFLSVEDQDEIFREITEAYRVKIQLLDDAGENDLEITTMPLRAETKKKQIWHQGENPDSGNAFADNTYVEEVEADVLKKPMKRSEIADTTRKLMGDLYSEKNGSVDWQHYVDEKGAEIAQFYTDKANDALAKMKEAGEARIAKAREKAVRDATKARGRGENNFTDAEIQSLADTVAEEARTKEEYKQQKRHDEIMSVNSRIQTYLRRLRAESVYVVPTDLKQGTPEMFSQTFGTFVGFKFNKGYTLGSSTAIFATLDGRRKVELALSDSAINTILSATDIAYRYSPKEIGSISMENWDSKVPNQTRQKRYIITGNLLQALVDTEKGEKTRGNLISYSTIDGETRQGILMGENFKLTDLRNSVPLSSRLEQIREGKAITSENGEVTISKVVFGWQHRGDFELSVPKSKQRGGVYYTDPGLLKLVDGNNFVTKGNNMVGYIEPSNLAKVVDILSYAPFNVTVLQEPKLTDVNTSTEAEEDVLCRPVTDKATLDRLNNEKTIKVYRAMQIIDGGLRPPMSAKIDGQLREATEVGVWEEAEEHPEMADENGRFKLDKGNGKSIKAAYNPYIHTSRSPINDQFSSAWSRPELVIVEVEIPESELTSEYRAEKAKDSVGEKEWKSGPIGRALAKIGQPRRVILSRWSRVVRVVPVEEVADAYAQHLNAHGVEVPFNTVPPALREALAKRGVKIGAPEKGNAGQASLPAFEQWISEQERERMGDGYGGYTDAELSYLNDPISKVLGKNRFSKKRQAEFAARERERMTERVKQIAEALHLDNVEVITDASTLEGKRAKAKGYYNKRTEKITIVIPNNVNTLDAEQTLLHEAVAHYGLRQLFGEHFDTFLDNVYQAADDEIRRKIAEMAAKNGWDFRTATEEYLATLAEDTEFENVRSNAGWWSKIKSLFLDMLEKIGFEGFRDKTGVVITDNELRYLLWRSYQNLAEPGRYRSILGEAEDIAMQQEMKVGNYAEKGIAAEGYAAEGELYRPGDFTPRDKQLARAAYNRICASGSYQFKEAVQDSMLGLKKLYESIVRNTRIEDMPGFENAYLYENRMSSANAGEQHEYFQRYMQPLLKEIGRLVGANKQKRKDLMDYLMAKHGLERNERMRNEAATNGEATDRDFAGLMGLTGEADWRSAEGVAQQWVDDYEASVDTAALWEAINNATKATLEKVYMSGIISKETYEKICDMYEYYIPLRGWDETTSDEVYGYLTSKDGPLGGSIMKKAEGRESMADDPIATIGMMADDAIRQGNRNLMKQRFLNFVLNHPSDAVSVHDIWLEHDDVTDEWRPVFVDVENSDTADEVAQKVEAFEQRMEALRNAEPDKYKKGREAQNIPYKVVRGNLREHQILIKRNGRTYVCTINGNPRAAQAINGLTNPDVDQNGVVGNMLKAGIWINRQLSAFYTTRNPDFVVSNFFRDMLYSNCMTWVKESPRYALRFHKNFGRVNPVTMRRLLGKWESGTLNSGNRLEDLFYQFMKNGGETGYTNVRDIEGHKRAVAAELKKQGSTGRRVWAALGMQLDLLNRAAENCARFAAFVTSREFGRSIDRSIYDAKEISVNFNKKGSGGKMVNATGQTTLGKAGAYIGGGGRILYVFWNAGIQGMTNFCRQAKLHPVKFTTGASALFALGYVIPMLAQMLGGGDGDDDDKNAYYNLPEYVRRSNICFYAGNQWVTIPLPIEYRAMYGLGELAHGVISGNELYDNEELGRQMAAQVTQIMPLDMLEGGGGLSPFIPSAAKPLTEAYIMNTSWTGLPVYKDTPFNKNDPEWTKAYASADQHLVSFAKWLNETSGGDDFKKGAIDINPAKIEHLLNGTFGGLFSFPNKIKKSAETAFSDREFEWRNIPIANRLIKSGDERTAHRKLQNEYFKYKKEYEETGKLMRNYEKADEQGVMGYAEKINFLENSPEYARWEIFDEFKPDLDAYREEIAVETDKEERARLEAEMYGLMRELIDALHDPAKYQERNGEE